LNIIENIHGNYVLDRRVKRLSSLISNLLPDNASVLDVGCGDGKISATIQNIRKNVTIQGLEVIERSDCAIPFILFDSINIPFDDNSYDCVMFTDVLHHASNIPQLIKEALRVARKSVIIKDHLLKGIGAQCILQFMDNVGNTRHGVPSPGQYLTKGQWFHLFEELGSSVEEWNESLKLYPFPVSIFFGRHLHMLTKISPQQ
jgi:SAM-dependent methyltransferase